MFNFIALEAEEAAEQTSNLVKEAANVDFSKLTDHALDYALEAGRSVLIAILIYVVGRMVIKMINKLVAKVLERRKVDDTIQGFAKSLVSVLLTTLLIVAVINALGVDTTSFAALLASVGLAAGMALSGNLQNLAGGIMLLLFRPFRVGDFIEAQGEMGVVKEIQILHTIILTVDNREVILPNGALSSGNMTNYSKEPLRRVDLTIGIEYGQDVENARRVLNKIFAADERILNDPAPFVGLVSLEASSVDLTVRVWVKGENYWDVYFSLNETIYNTFNKEGISFPFPQIKVHQA